MEATLFDHEKLKVYQEALRFVGWIHPRLEQLPAKISAKDQLARASTSVVLNPAEGNVSMTAGVIARFSGTGKVQEDSADYSSNTGIEEKDKE